MTNKIKVLFLAADPLDVGYRPLLGKEAREIEQKIRTGADRDSFEFDISMAVRPGDLQDILLTHCPNIVHFSGHGSKAQGIMLEDDFGKRKMVSGPTLVNLFKHFKSDIRLIFLNACHSKQQAQALSHVIDYTIGMKDTVGDKAAIVFAAAFYRGLAFNLSVKKAFDLAITQLQLDNLSDVETPELLVRKGVKTSEPLLESLGTDHVREHLRKPQAPSRKVKRPTGRTIRGSSRQNAAPKPRIRATRASSTAQQKAALRRLLRQLKTKLERLASGTATQQDQAVVQRDVIDGKIIFNIIDSEKVTAVDSQRHIKVGAGNNQINVELSPAAYEQVQKRLFPPPPGIAPPLPPLMFIGREDALRDLKRLIGAANSTSRLSNVFVVRGWPGVGRTTLANVIAHDPDVIKAFPDGVLWASLGQEPNLLSGLAWWGEALGTDELLRAPTLKDVAARLATLLRDKRMLLIVDDVREPAHATPFLMARGADCALLMTTRQTRVAEALSIASESIYVLPPLTEDNALRLIGSLAPAVVEQHPDACRELVKALECLPLALQVVGRLLKSEAKLGRAAADSLKGILEAAKQIISETSPADWVEEKTIPSVSALLKKSTDLLDDLARECFALLGAFAPSPATFNLMAMKTVWQVEAPEPIVRRLVDHGLLEPVGAGRFQMHDLLVQHARSLLT